MLYQKPKESLICCVCRHLLDGNVITTIDTIKQGLGWRLAARVHYLKKDYDWPIESQKVQLANGKAEITQYWLMPDLELSTLQFPHSAKHLTTRYTGEELGLTDHRIPPAQPLLPFDGDWL